MKSLDVSKLNIPDFEEVVKGINQLILIEDWDRYKIKRSNKKFLQRLDALFLKNLKLLPTFFTPIDSSSFPFKFYRVRKEDKKFNPSLLSEYSYPPVEFVKNTQRANLPFSPVFYCSDNPAVAIAETVKFKENVNSKDFYYLSEWKLKPGLKIRLTPYLFSNLDEDSFYNFWIENNKYQLKKTLQKENLEARYESFYKIMEFLSNLFIYENSYVVSSYIAHNHLYAPHSMRTDIFVYPSVQLDKKAVNYAIHPNVVTEKMNLSKIFKLNFDSIDKQEGIKYTIKEVGKNNDSIIFWNRDLEQEIENIKDTFPEFKIKHPKNQ